MTRCHICGVRCEHEVEPAFGEHLPAVMERDVWHVVARNLLILDACQRCWMLWPDDWKHFPAEGFGRILQPERPRRSVVGLEDLVGLLRETAP